MQEDHADDEDEAMKDADDDNAADDGGKEEAQHEDEPMDGLEGANGTGPPSKRAKLK